jgi:DNA-binding response OmpR family regulator
VRLPDWFKRWNAPAPITEVRVSILALSIPLEDRFFLERLGELNNWALRFADSPREGFRMAAQSYFQLILCDRHQPGHPWREVMDRLAASSPRSCILLVSPMSDDYLWSDVLQQGGYDVLVRPLREKAVLHSIDAAVRFTSAPASFSSR